MTTNLIPTDSYDEIGPLTAYALYRTFDTYEEMLRNAPPALSRCLTYQSPTTGRWTMKTIEYYPEDEYYPPAAGHHYHPKGGDLPECPVRL